MAALRTAWKLSRESISQWLADNAMRHSAAISFYALLSMAPVLVLMLAVTGWMLGPSAASHELSQWLGQYVGPESAKTLEDMVARAQSSRGSTLAVVLGIASLLVGATGVFVQLQEAMNEIWNVKATPRNAILGAIVKRVMSFVLVLVLGAALTALVALSAALSALQTVLPPELARQAELWWVLKEALSLALLTLLFALIFKVLPDACIGWRHVWFGAIITSVLFMLGQLGLSWYLGRGALASAYGAAGSLVVVLVWVYYSAMIFFLGAEFTQAWARHTGEPIVPSKHAVAVERE
jgi:membrane protein